MYFDEVFKIDDLSSNKYFIDVGNIQLYVQEFYWKVTFFFQIFFFSWN